MKANRPRKKHQLLKFSAECVAADRSLKGRIPGVGVMCESGGIVYSVLKVHKIEIFFGFDFEICIISLLVMSKY